MCERSQNLDVNVDGCKHYWCGDSVPQTAKTNFVCDSNFPFFLFLPHPSPCSLFQSLFSLSRTRSPPGAGGWFTCGAECQLVRLGFPLCCSSSESVKLCLLESSSNTPWKAISSFAPSVSLYPLSKEGKRKWNSLITNPSLWTKRICIISGAIESLHPTRLLPWNPSPALQFSYEFNLITIFLSSVSLSHTFRICTFCLADLSDLVHALSTLLFFPIAPTEVKLIESVY